MNITRIDLNLLPVLDAILSTQSVGKAAAIIGLSKPATSHALSRIRRQLADPVLVRAGQRWVLTERAAAVAPRVRAALAEARNVLCADRTFDPKSLQREFRIHATDEMLSLLGLELGHRVASAAPGVGLRFLPLEVDESAALRGDIDLALGVFADLAPELRIQKLFDDAYACVTRASASKTKSTMSLARYLAARHVVIAPPGRTGRIVDDALAQLGHARRAVRWVPYSLSAIEFVAESDCIATVSRRFAKKHAARYGLRVFELPFVLPSCAGAQVWHPRLDAHPAHAWLRRLVAGLVSDVLTAS